MLSGIMCRMGILGSLIKSPTRRGCSVALCVEWAFWVTLFNPPIMRGCLVALCGEWAFGVTLLNPLTRRGCSVALCGEYAFRPTPFNRPPIEDSMYVVFFGRITFCSTHFKLLLHNGIIFPLCLQAVFSLTIINRSFPF